jgi:hypothetical protein
LSNTPAKAAATAAAVIVDDMPRRAPEIDPGNVVVNADGFVWRSLFLRLPEGMIADDLKQPEIFRRLQASPKSVRMFDQLTLVAFDQTWMATAIVGFADATKAVLCRPSVLTMPERHDKMLETDEYRIRWLGATYGVERKSDGHIMAREVNLPLAERALRNLYPRPAAA